MMGMGGRRRVAEGGGGGAERTMDEKERNDE